MMDKYYVNDTTVIPVYIFEADDVTPAPASDVTWEYVDPESQSPIDIHVPKPSTGPTVAVGTSGTMSGTYDYTYSNVDSDGFEGATSPPSTITVTSKKVNLSLPAAPSGVITRNVYRRKAPNDVYRLIASTGTGSLNYVDDLNNDNENEYRTPTLAHGNTMAKFVGPGGYFTNPGLYLLAARFTLLNGLSRTFQLAFQIVDPLAVAVTEVDKTVDLAWMMFEDCYDSIEGGPHLQDETKAIFDNEKFFNFFDIALFNISMAQPPQTYTADSFPYSTARPLLAKGMMLEAIKHLMRSYVEQPLPVNDPTMHLQRRDYLERWKMIYDMEKAEFDSWLVLFKRDQYGFGRTSMLVGGQSGLRTPRILRTRYPRFAGGWWGRW
jgi:hypothetical protein